MKKRNNVMVGGLLVLALGSIPAIVSAQATATPAPAAVAPAPAAAPAPVAVVPAPAVAPTPTAVAPAPAAVPAPAAPAAQPTVIVNVGSAPALAPAPAAPAPTAPQPTAVKTPKAAKKVGGYVKLYDDAGFGGGVVSISFGQDVADIRSLGFNDRASAVKYSVPAGWSVVLYDDVGYGRGQYPLKGTSSVSHLGYWNDRTSAVRWVKQ